GNRRRGGPRRATRDRLARDGGRDLAPLEGVRREHLPVGVLRQVPKPLRSLVHDGCLRQPREGPKLPAPQGGRREKRSHRRLNGRRWLSPPGSVPLPACYFLLTFVVAVAELLTVFGSASFARALAVLEALPCLV